MIEWFFFFIFSLALLIKSADWFIESAEKIGLALKIHPFIIGVTIIAIGTSLPELGVAIASVLKGVGELAVANTVGTIIANILLIGGLSAIAAKTLFVERNLVDLDTPLFAGAMALYILTMIDKKITSKEGLILLITFVAYLCYTIMKKEEGKFFLKAQKVTLKEIFFLFLGMIGLAFGANYTIDSTVKLAHFFEIPPSLITIIATAVGTSLPEMVVSVGAAFKKKFDIALGNVFGSNVFDALLIGGAPALIKPLFLDDLTFKVGLPFLGGAAILLIISSISQRIHLWEGLFYILVYILFLMKLLGWG